MCVSQICQVISEVSNANQDLLRKYKREMNLRKKCHNELVRLKGPSAFELQSKEFKGIKERKNKLS